MLKTRIAYQVEQHGPIEIGEFDLPEPGPWDVVVKIEASGICQSQIMWTTQPRTAPMLFGHEGIGRVEVVGAKVDGLQIGERVLVTWLPREVERDVPRAGLPLPSGEVALSPNVYTWATRVCLDEAYVRPLPAGEWSHATSVVGCSVITGAGAVVNVGSVSAGDKVVVIGAGGVGLSAIAAASIRGAAEVVAVDMSEESLAMAKRMGATQCVNAREGDVVATIGDLLGDGADYVFDCVGMTATVSQSLALLRSQILGSSRRGGEAVVVGVPKEPFPLDLMNLMTRGVTLTGTLAGSCVQDQIDDFLGWVKDGLFPVDELVTDTYSFADLDEGVTAITNGTLAGRAIVVMEEETR